ncbi:MAG: class E sortase [Ilumatobacter sp.]
MPTTRPDDGPSDGTSAATRLKVGVPAAIALVAVGAVPFVLDGEDDSIRTAGVEAPATPASTAPPTTEVERPEPVFTSAGVTVETDATGTTTTTTTAVASTLPAEPEAGDATAAVEVAEAPAVVEASAEQPTAPIAPPADPRGFEEQDQLGGISIPKLDVEAPLLEGIRLTTLDNGPGHWPGTAMPGEVGNVVVAAHRTSHGGPFRHIDQLVEGDSVFFDTDAGEVEYHVTSTQIVGPDALWIVNPSDDATATLFACHPPGSVAQRIVVKLELA